MTADPCEVNDLSFDRPLPVRERYHARSLATKWLRSRRAFPVSGWSRWVPVVLSAVWLAGCDAPGTQPQPEVPVTGSIAGTVSADGEGLPGVTVSAFGWTATTGSGGAYRFDNVAGGTHEVSISGHPADVSFPSTTASATISSAGQTVTVDFAGTYLRTSAITGTVSVGGSGAAGLTVTLDGTESATAHTGDAGEYAFENLRAGSYVVRISGFDPEAVSFDRTSAEVVLGAGESATADFNGVSLAAEQEALLTLLDATGGTWANALGWSADRPVSEWGGVETDSTGAVTGLRLSGVGMEGELPPELGKLTRLKVLDVSGNKLTGSIPKELANLWKARSLRTVDLTGNALTGHVNRLFTSGDTSLVSPDSIVQAADADGASANTIALTHFYAGGNRLTGEIPPEVGGFPNLEVLDLSGNDLTGPIPPELGNLSKLRVLDLGGSWRPNGESAFNTLTGEIPPELGRLSNLEWLLLGDNALTGPIPPELGNLSKLRELDLGRRLRPDGESISNDLTGPIPPELGGLSNLEGLRLGWNALSGSIPPELGNLVTLRWLDLGWNALTGPIPPELGGISKLRHLDLSGNALTGDIPPELGGLSNLELLQLYANALTGEIPPELGRLSNLEELQLDGNALTGPIPPELGSLSNLEGLDLAGNVLTGPIPPELGNLAKLRWLHLGYNALTGPIPPELGRLSNLEWLGLSGADLTGPIPPEFGRLSRLRGLTVDRNFDLYGTLPRRLTNLGYLERFWFDETSLCAPNDDEFVAWMEAVEARSTDLLQTVRGPYCDRGTPEVLLRDDFATRESLDNWTLGNSRTSAGVDNGLLYLSITEEGWTALAYQAFDDGVSATDWRVTARVARERDDVRMIIWLFMDHDVYQHYRFEIGSGYDVGDRDTNYRFFAWNDNRDGPGEGGWVYFSGLGHGVSDAINDGANEFNEVDYSIIDGALSMNVNGTTVAGPVVLSRPLATDIVGIGLASAHAGGGEYATTLFDWVELNGELLGAATGGAVERAHIPPEVADRVRRLEARLAAGDVKEERMPGGSR